MTRSLTAAIQSARQLMNKGILGKQLWNSVIANHPNLSNQEQLALSKRIASEHGVLGQVMFDPNLHSNCRQATTAKQASPNKGLMILTQQTPYCDSCGYRKGSSCSLMGGQIVANAQDVPEQVVHRVASLLETNNEIPANVARRIRTSEQPAAKRVAALAVARTKSFDHSPAADLQAQMDSTRVASILEPGKQKMRVPKNKPTRIASTVDFQLSDKDQKISRQASSAAQMLNTPAMTIDTSYISVSPREATINAQTTLDYHPEKRKAVSREASVEEEHSMHAHQQLNKMMRIAGRILGRGEMTLRLAGELLTKTEELMEQGGGLSPKAARIAHQLEVMVGTTADIEGDLTS